MAPSRDEEIEAVIALVVVLAIGGIVIGIAMTVGGVMLAAGANFGAVSLYTISGTHSGIM